MRIGHGYDVHKLCAGRKLIIGGVEIDNDKGLIGHSDADVLIHAIIDSILGAAGMGDIGKMFPESDIKYKNANSMELLRQVYTRINTAGYKIVNIDSTIIAQGPKLTCYTGQMSMNISSVCSINSNNVNIKATTEEGLGFTGNYEGIAAHAVCLICND